MHLPDIQDSRDSRGIAIDEVGITNLRTRISFDDGVTRQQGIARVDVGVALAADRRGTHMSRMVQLAESILADFDPRSLTVPMKEAARLLDADSAILNVSFPLGTTVTAPQSGLTSVQVHDVQVHARHDGGLTKLLTSVSTDITTLCPCSQAVSDYGAHNQRSRVSVEVLGIDPDTYPVRVIELVDLIRSVGSAPVYPLIKRGDERSVTMQAFDSPAFVEDVVRDLSVALRRRQVSHTVTSVNVESIHSHDAKAVLSWAVAEGGKSV